MKNIYKEYKTYINKLVISMISLIVICAFGITLKMINSPETILKEELLKGIVVLFISFFLFSAIIYVGHNKKG